MSLRLSQCPLLSGEENADILLDYCNRKLDPLTVGLLEQHMSVCPACRAFADSQAAVWEALDSFQPPPISSDFDARLWARIEASERLPWYTRFWQQLTASATPIWRPALPVAAALIIGVGLWLRPVPPPEFNAPEVTAAVEAEEIETALEDLEMLRQLHASDTSSPSKQM